MNAEREARIAARRMRIAASLRASRTSNKNEEINTEGEKDKAKNLFARKEEMAATLLKTQLKNKILLLRNLASERAFNYTKSSWNCTKKITERSVEDAHEFEASKKQDNFQASLSTCNISQDLRDLIADLMKENESNLIRKRKAIEAMKMELSEKDDEYSNSISLQQKDVQALLTMMSYQALKLREFYLQELQDVERMFLGQRGILLSSNKSKMASLLQNRIDLETTYADEVHSCKDKFLKLLDEIRENDVEDFNSLKVRLEADAQSLEEHLQVMQAMYQLNAEKLEYNLLVLTEREYENYVMTNQQKKKLTRQRDTLSNIKGRHRELEKSFLGHNERLAEDYNRVTKLLQDLQLKERSLQSSHALIKQRFFYMHQHMISGVVSRILQADKQIQEEELGWIWKSPCNTVLHRLGSQLSRKDSQSENPMALMENDQFRTLLESLSKERYHAFLRTLIKEASFLIDREYLKDLKCIDEKLQFQVWSATILNALGVVNTYSLEKIFIFFTNRMEIDDGVNMLKLKALIQGESFSETFSQENDDLNTLTYTITKGRPSIKTQSSREIAEKLNWSGYWNSFTTIISPKVLRVYRHLNSALLSYNQMLKDRLSASKDVLLIRQRNQRLQITLDYCLSSRQ